MQADSSSADAALPVFGGTARPKHRTVRQRGCKVAGPSTASPRRSTRARDSSDNCFAVEQPCPILVYPTGHVNVIAWTGRAPARPVRLDAQREQLFRAPVKSGLLANRQQREFNAPVHRAAFSRSIVCDRVVLAPAYDNSTVTLNAAGHQIFSDRISAAL